MRVRLRDVAERADVHYAAMSLAVRQRYADPKYPLVPLGEISRLIQYGTSELASYERGGLPIVVASWHLANACRATVSGRRSDPVGNLRKPQTPGPAGADWWAWTPNWARSSPPSGLGYGRYDATVA